MTAKGFRLGVLMAALLPGLAVAAPDCPTHPTPIGLQQIQDVMATGRFVAYQPTGLKVVDGVSTHVDEASLTADLQVLRARFDGLITYNAAHGAERIPDVAAKLGYRAVIMGIWDITNQTERGNVIAAAKRVPGVVAGVSVGNEVVYGKRRTFSEITTSIKSLRTAAPTLAIATTEPFHLLLEPSAKPVLQNIDILLANVHPVFEPWFKAAPDFNAADFVVKVTDQLSAVYCGPVLVKETGVPTAPTGKGFTPLRQESFYRALQKQFTPTSTKAFAFFSAFDAPWRAYDAHPVPGAHPEEAHWGLYDENRKAKPVVDVIPALLKP